ncbi:Lrp/AsnC family transcriptional regulator [Pseudoroseicyclus tamaricis]|nr:Lrp/AsnC family transcriptional regulator [Pseudoroseicyclus tamaricis]
MAEIMLDNTDRRLLRIWQSEPELSLADLAERAGVTALKAGRRVAKMEEAGVIQGQEAVIDWRALGYVVAVSLRVTLDKTAARAFEDFLEGARAIPEVTEIQTFLGRVDVRLHVIARDLGHYQQIYRQRILTLPHIADIESLMTLTEVKRDEALPL